VIRSALTLASKDLLLELRRRDVVLAMAQFVLATLVIVHFAISGATSPKAAAGMLWAAIIFTALLGLGRSHAAEFEEDALDLLWLAPIDRAAVWLGKVISQLAFLAVMELVAIPAFYLFFFTSQRPNPLIVIAAVLLADIGLAASGVLVAALAAAARTRDVLLPVLFLPITIPLVIGGVAATLDAFGGGAARPLGFLALYDTLFFALAMGTYEHLAGE
jgi:heme exporter protein B